MGCVFKHFLCFLQTVCGGVCARQKARHGDKRKKANPPCKVWWSFVAAKGSLPLLSSPLLSSPLQVSMFPVRSRRKLALHTPPWKKHLGQQFTQQLLWRRGKEDIGENEASGAPPNTHKYTNIYIDIYCVHYWCHPVLQTLPYNVLFNAFREHFNGAFVPWKKAMQCIVFKLD